MTFSPVDTTFAVQSALTDDPVRKKQEMDALRGRLGDSRSDDQKLQEACEGFEAIFIQKLWEQMRKNVPKEGYLHSKDEEAYQSMFDTELAKKMTSAGGIGLADMLKEQLSQRMQGASRGAITGGMREPLAIATPREALAEARAREVAVVDLYSPVEEETTEQSAVAAAPDTESILRQALQELEEERASANTPEVLAAMAGPWVGRQPHMVLPGAEPRIVANGPGPHPVMPGRVRAPGREAPSETRIIPAQRPEAAGVAEPAAFTAEARAPGHVQGPALGQASSQVSGFASHQAMGSATPVMSGLEADRARFMADFQAQIQSVAAGTEAGQAAAVPAQFQAQFQPQFPAHDQEQRQAWAEPQGAVQAGRGAAGETPESVSPFARPVRSEGSASSGPQPLNVFGAVPGDAETDGNA